MSEEMEVEDNMFGKYVIAYSDKSSLSGECIWDDGINALCVNELWIQGHNWGYLFLIESHLRGKVAVFSLDERIEEICHIAGTCSCWECDGNHVCPGEYKIWPYISMANEVVDTICRINNVEDEEHWAGIGERERGGEHTCSLIDSPGMALKCIIACKNAGDGKVRSDRELARMNQYEAKHFLIMDDCFNISDAYVLKYANDKFLVSEETAGGNCTHTWRDKNEVLAAVNKSNGRQDRLRKLREILPQDWARLSPDTPYNLDAELAF